MRNFKLTLSYDGTEYCGWQVQPNGRTVQDELERAIEKVVGVRCSAKASGRTDTGVHAVGQVVNFRSTTGIAPERLLQAINANLPRDIVIREVQEVPEEFDANRDAIRKLYRYVIRDHPIADPFMSRFEYQYRYALDVAKMRLAAVFLQGKHDFRCFETEWPNRASSVRTITRITVNRVGERIWLDVEADGFLYNMVRAITGTLINVGRGFWPPEKVGDLLAHGERKDAGATAPAQGLFLIRVTYPKTVEIEPHPGI